MVVGMGIALWLAALALPAFSPFAPQSNAYTVTGWEAFDIGWNMLTSSWLDDSHSHEGSLAWLANPAIWAALIAAGWGRWRIAAVAAFCGLALCSILLPRSGVYVVRNPGYWAWCASAAFLLVSSVWLRVVEKSGGRFRITIPEWDGQLGVPKQEGGSASICSQEPRKEHSASIRGAEKGLIGPADIRLRGRRE